MILEQDVTMSFRHGYFFENIGIFLLFDAGICAMIC